MAITGVEVKFKPRKGFRTLERHLKKVDESSAQWGVYTSSGIHKSSGLSFAHLMGIHELREDEFRRPVLGISADKYKKDYVKSMAKGLKVYITGAASNTNKSIETALLGTAKLGAKKAKSIFGDTTLLKDNAQSTIKQKGSNNPMIEFGSLKRAIKYKVKGKEVN